MSRISLERPTLPHPPEAHAPRLWSMICRQTGGTVESLHHLFTASVLRLGGLHRDDGRNDWTGDKRLGVFIAERHTLSDDHRDLLLEHGFEPKPEEPTMELHVPPQRLGRSDLLRSMQRLAVYLDANRDKPEFPRHVYGVTYLGGYAGRYGFTVMDMPPELRDRTKAATLLRLYKMSRHPTRRRIAELFTSEDIQLCAMETDQLLADHLN